ncbi:hypothetical protein MKZ38_003889 [Zalerion maritima]|uniref:NmrA-like domain-containing protein n=1 Tax=Zalerion maritima TaxID=339359 RepID=A0AAD5WWI6_9PEZI|nr:hypothetical protein MKZ38_003889 [Zalerion maritima]
MLPYETIHICNPDAMECQEYKEAGGETSRHLEGEMVSSRQSIPSITTKQSGSSNMTSFKNIAVVGGAGNLGPAIVKALLDADFNVTALSREGSTSTFPSGVTVKKVNYDSSDSVTAALEGQDALVSVIASPAIKNQIALVDAAIAAGVKRIIPSEFGINTRVANGAIAKILSAKVQTVDYLMEKAKSVPGFTWTGLANSLFFDWGLTRGTVGFNAATKTATIYDSGNEPVSGTNLAYIGKGVAGILKHPEETANKYLCIASFTTTQNEILASIEKETGEKWKVEHVKTADLQKSGEEKLAQGHPMAFPDLVRAWSFADGCGHAFKPGENAAGMLGLEKESLEETLRVWMKEKGLIA